MHIYRIFTNLSISASVSMLLAGCAVRSIAVDAGKKTELIYSMQWGLGMHESISLVRNNRLLARVSDEIYDRVRNSGGSLFANKERSLYYIAFTIGVQKIDLRKGRIDGTCTLDDDLAQSLDYIGYFGLTEFDYRDSPRGKDVTFTPAGQTPPVLRYDRAPGSIEELKDRCG